MSRECFRKNIRAYLVPKLTNMPGMKKYLESINDEQWQQFSQAVLKAALKTDGEIMETGDISTFCVILHYVEAIMTRYDIIHEQGLPIPDGILTVGEADNAFPVFKGMIKTIGQKLLKKDLTDWRAKAAFFYILSNQQIPLCNFQQKDAGISHYLTAWSFKLTRLQVAQVFSIIIENIKPKPEAAKKDGASQCSWLSELSDFLDF